MCSGSNNGLVLQTFNPPLWNKLHSKIPKGKGGRAPGKLLFNECRSQSGVHKILYCGIFEKSLSQKKPLHMHFLWKLNVLCSQDVNLEPMKDFKRPSMEMEK